MVPGTLIPDIKSRLIATGLMDRIEDGQSISLPNNGDSENRPKTDKLPPVQGEGFVLVGSDVEKLYPSLRSLEAARLVRMAAIDTKIEFLGVDFKKALRYIYVVGGIELIDRAGLNRLAPTWLGKRSDLLSVGGVKTNEDKWWRDSSRIIHRHEKKKIVGIVLEIGVIAAMGTHLYTFNEITYIQLQGGPIGLRLTAALAALVMCYFDKTLSSLLDRERIKTLLSFRYVDDSRLGLRPINPGWRWKGNKLEFVRELVEEDIEIGPQRRTTNVVKDILNSIVTYLKFTTEDCEDFQSGKLPTLDCELWVVDNEIRYQFYEKPQCSNRLLLKNTALSATSLMSSLVQEGVRRLLNTSIGGETHIRDDIMNKFSKKLMNSGYSN